MLKADDIVHMRHAQAMAQRNRGITWPNPSVGCVIVKNNRIVGRGTTQRGGIPHAEVVALQMAGPHTTGATAYVTLEPCVHHGKSGPCTDALIKSKISRVVVGCQDPDARVSGRGARALKKAGISVDFMPDNLDLDKGHLGFIKKTNDHRPHVTLKIATTQEGFTVLPHHPGQWITGPLSRRHVHLKRSEHDAVLVGINTVLQDNPSLDARVPGFEHETVRVVLDEKRQIKEKCQLFLKNLPVWLVHTGSRDEEKNYVQIAADPHDLNEVLYLFAQKGLNRLFVEGGACVIRSFLRADLWDEFLWYRAPITLSEKDQEQTPPTQKLDQNDLITNYGLNLIKTRTVLPDRLEIYHKTI